MGIVIQLLIALGLLHTSLANPFPQGGTCGDPFTKCPDPTYEEISSTRKKLEPQVVTGTRLKGCDSGCELSTETSWSVSVTIEVGASLGLDYAAASAGIGVSVAYSETQGEAYSQSIGCPADAWCMLMITDHVVEVKGNKVWKNQEGCSCEDKTEPYSIDLPETVESASGTSAVISYEGCFLRKPKKPIEGFSYRNCPGGEEEIKELKGLLTTVPLIVPDEPKPDKKKDSKPDKKENPQPTKKENPQPTKKEDPQPTKKEDPKPNKKEDPQPTKKEDPKPDKNEG